MLFLFVPVLQHPRGLTVLGQVVIPSHIVTRG